MTAAATYGVGGHPSDISPLGAGQIHRFQAGSLADAQAYAQALATLLQAKVVLHNEAVAANGDVQTVYSPAAAGSTINGPTTIVHR